MIALKQAIVRRRPWPAELLLISWVALCVGNAAVGLGMANIPPILNRSGGGPLWALPALATTLAGFYGLARQRRRRAMLTCGCIVLVTGIASGALQLGSCPHATYLQIVGLDIPIWGDPCRNNQIQNLRPWWSR